MKRIRLDYLPAFLAVAVLLIVSAFKALRIIPGTQEHDFETVTNAAMFGTAVVSLFFAGLPAKRDSERQLGGVLSNLAVSALAFLINIVVFEHVIDWEHPLNDLWGGHAGWFLWMVIQLLLLSGLGELLLGWIRKFLAWLGRRKDGLGKASVQIMDTIKRNDKGIITILGTSVLLWVLYLSGKVLATGTVDVLAYPNTLKEGMLLWVVSIIIGAFVYSSPLMFRKVKSAVDTLNPRKMLTAFMAAAILMLLFFVLLNQLGVWGGVLAVLAGAVGLTGLLLEKHHRTSTPSQHSSKSCVINPRDMVIVVLAFLAPLLLTGALTICSSAGQVFIAGDKTEFTTWLNFGEAYLNVAGALLNLLT